MVNEWYGVSCRHHPGLASDAAINCRPEKKLPLTTANNAFDAIIPPLETAHFLTLNSIFRPAIKCFSLSVLTQSRAHYSNVTNFNCSQEKIFCCALCGKWIMCEVQMRFAISWNSIYTRATCEQTLNCWQVGIQIYFVFWGLGEFCVSFSWFLFEVF